MHELATWPGERLAEVAARRPPVGSPEAEAVLHRRVANLVTSLVNQGHRQGNRLAFSRATLLAHVLLQWGGAGQLDGDSVVRIGGWPGPRPAWLDDCLVQWLDANGRRHKGVTAAALAASASPTCGPELALTALWLEPTRSRMLNAARLAEESPVRAAACERALRKARAAHRDATRRAVESALVQTASEETTALLTRWIGPAPTPPRELPPADRIPELLACLRRRAPEHFAVACLGFATGLEVGELLHLPRRDFFPRQGKVAVPARGARGAHAVSIQTDLVEILRRHIGTFDAAKHRSDLLFPSADGTEQQASGLARALAAASRGINLTPPFTPSMMRLFYDQQGHAPDLGDLGQLEEGVGDEPTQTPTPAPAPAPTPAPRLPVQRGSRPAGTLTLEEARAHHPGFAATQQTTLRMHLRPAMIGKWGPEGKSTTLALYDPSRVAELAASPPRHRGVPDKRRPRRRKVPPGQEHTRAPPGVPDGWCTLAQLAAELGEEKEALRRRIEGHGDGVWRQRQTVELQTLRALLVEEHLDPVEAARVPEERRLVGDRVKKTYERGAAWSALRGAQPEEVAWRRWLGTVLSRRNFPPGDVRDTLVTELLARLQDESFGDTEAAALRHVRKKIDTAMNTARERLDPRERQGVLSGWPGKKQ